MVETNEIISALRLINTPKIGAVAYFKMLNKYGNEDDAISALEATGSTPWSIERAQLELENCHNSGIDIILYKDERYPAMLKNISDMPPILYVKGNIQTLHFARSIAVVGSRSASINGCRIAEEIAHDLANKDVCIASGMARGIDTAAHIGALSAGMGSTVAVLGTGIDQIYPPENRELYNQIAEKGCIISEFPLGTLVSPSNFPRRNRIIAGLSQAVLVVEAGLNSGSLITAQYAMKQSKPIFAIPGTPDFSHSSGSNMLIKKGAYLVENAIDIWPYLQKNKVLPPNITPKQKVLVFPNNDVKFSKNENTDSALVKFLTVDGVDIDELVRLTGKTAAELSALISELELSGTVRRISGNRIALAK